MKIPDSGTRLGQLGLHPKNSALQGIVAEFFINFQPGFDPTGNQNAKIGVRFLHAAIQPPGTKLSHRFPEVFTAGDGKAQIFYLLAGAVRRQEGKGKVVPPDGGAVACRQFILKGKDLNAIPLFYSVIRFLSRLRTML